MDVGPLTVEEARAVIEWLRTLWNALLEEGTEVKDEQASADADDGIVNVEPIASSSSQSPPSLENLHVYGTRSTTYRSSKVKDDAKVKLPAQEKTPSPKIESDGKEKLRQTLAPSPEPQPKPDLSDPKCTPRSTRARKRVTPRDSSDGDYDPTPSRRDKQRLQS